MSYATGSSDLARETLRLLASRRVSPTPENYRQCYQEITGQLVDDRKEQGPAALQWAQLILDLLKQWRHAIAA